MPTDSHKLIEDVIGQTATDRRGNRRYKFTGVASVTDESSGVQVRAQVGDLGQHGCYLVTDTPFPLHATVKVRITKAKEFLEANGRVVFSSARKGMGIFFTAVDSKHQEVLTGWLLTSLETSWLNSSRRRSQRIVVQLSVIVSGKNSRGTPFEEETQTQAISAHGALILLSMPVVKGQILTMSNTEPKASLDCIVAHINESPGNATQIGVSFLLPNALFWHATFPSPNWSKHHEDAK